MKLNPLFWAVFAGATVLGSPGLMAAPLPAGALEAPVATFNATGIVLDKDGEPLIGATVQEKGNPTNGTQTDIDGKYTLKVKKGASLVISYVGMVKQTVAAGQNVETVLETDSQVLDDVVVVGFGTQKKGNLTGAVAVASGKEIQSRPVKNATDALQGLLPGLQLTHDAGDIETNMSIQIRGLGTIGEGSSGSPLILIDGMEADINTVNPQDIEQVTVLKDAAASSIYGSRAAFGVVLVTTKKGSATNAKVNYNNNFRWSSPIGVPKSMSSIDFAIFQNQASLNSGSQAFFTDEAMEQMINFIAAGGGNRGGLPIKNGNEWGDSRGHAFQYAYANTDWLSELYKTSFSMEHNASVSGGNEKVNYYASLGYADIGGMFRHGKDQRKRYNATGKFSAKLASWVTFNFSTRYTHTDTDNPNRFSSSWYSVIGPQTWPNLPVYDENGYYYNCEGSTPAMSAALGGTRKKQRNEIYEQAGLIFEPIKNWFIHGEFNYSYDNEERIDVSLPFFNHYVDGTLQTYEGFDSTLFNSYYRDKYINWNIFTDYSFSIKDANNFKVMLGFQSEEDKQAYQSLYGYGLQDENHPEVNLLTNLRWDSATQSYIEKAPEIHGYHNEWSVIGIFGRINYNFKDRYLIEGNLRYDGSSRFRSGRRWTWSPSVSIGWNIANEKFWEPITPYVNLLKLRASVGQLSNQSTYSWYPTYRTMSIGSQNGSWLQDGKRPNASWVNGLVSDLLTWEKVRTWNIGLDWGLFNNRLTGSFDAFIRDTKDMVGPPVELPNILGLAAPSYNNCELRSTGWELQIGWRDVTPFGLSYGISANISDARAKVTKYPGNTTGDVSQYLPGNYVGDIWGLTSIGMARTDEEMQAHLQHLDDVYTQVHGEAPATPLQGQSRYGISDLQAGDMMYKDVNGDGVIDWGDWTVHNPGDMRIIGNTSPRYFFGLDITAAYKGFDFRAFFQGVGKRDFYARTRTFWGAVEGGIWSTAGLQQHLDFFHADDIVVDYTDLNGNAAQYILPANTDSYYPRPRYAWGNQEWQTHYLQNAAYIRCKNMQLGYTIPLNITKKVGVSQFRLYVSVDNLFTCTKLSKLFDPETVGGGSWRDGERTADGNSYPLARTWSFGLQLSF